MSARTTRGFTLVELMVTVLIVSILVGVALPSYKSSVRKSRRTDAKTALLDLAGREERYFATNNGAYTDVIGNLGYTGVWPVPVGGNYYQILQPTWIPGTATAAATFSIQAIPVPGSDQAKDTSCATFTITNTGLQLSTPDPTCWN